MDGHVGDWNRKWEDLDFFNNNRLRIRPNGFDHFTVIYILSDKNVIKFEFLIRHFPSQRLTGTDEKNIVIFAIGRLDLRIDFDFSEPVAEHEKKEKKLVRGGFEQWNSIIPTHTGRVGERGSASQV